MSTSCTSTTTRPLTPLTIRWCDTPPCRFAIMMDRSDDTKRPNQQLTVLLLRHGERADEADGSASQRARSLQERVDPEMTVTGYRQATTAWKQIHSALECKAQAQRPSRTNSSLRVGVVCSPLRRCVGTALMLSAAARSPSDELSSISSIGLPYLIHWGWSSSTLFPIPVVICNGLCYCAAAIERLGGIAAIRQGLVPCAAKTAVASIPGTNGLNINEESGDTNSFGNELGKMLVNSRSAIALDEAQELDAGIRTRPSSCQPIQFVARGSRQEHDKQQRLHVDQPISPPATAMSFLSTVFDPINDASEEYLAVSYEHHGTFFDSLDLAAKQALDDSLDYLIVVTHREGIRDLANRCTRPSDQIKRFEERLSTPYCCVGIFAATQESMALHWRFNRVSTYQDFTANRI